LYIETTTKEYDYIKVLELNAKSTGVILGWVRDQNPEYYNGRGKNFKIFFSACDKLNPQYPFTIEILDDDKIIDSLNTIYRKKMNCINYTQI
jgi:hypothetical protein